MTQSDQIDWHAQYDALAKDVLELYGIVYAQLTDPEHPAADADERIAIAANEVAWAASRLKAHGIFAGAGFGEAASDEERSA